LTQKNCCTEQFGPAMATFPFVDFNDLVEMR
jgi:hypothetical protein